MAYSIFKAGRKRGVDERSGIEYQVAGRVGKSDFDIAVWTTHDEPRIVTKWDSNFLSAGSRGEGWVGRVPRTVEMLVSFDGENTTVIRRDPDGILMKTESREEVFAHLRVVEKTCEVEFPPIVRRALINTEETQKALGWKR